MLYAYLIGETLVCGNSHSNKDHWILFIPPKQPRYKHQIASFWVDSHTPKLSKSHLHKITPEFLLDEQRCQKSRVFQYSLRSGWSPHSGDYSLTSSFPFSHSHWVAPHTAGYLLQTLKNTSWIRFYQLSRQEIMEEGPTDTGLMTLLTKALWGCHYLDVAPVVYHVSFLERLSGTAKGILPCQMFRLLLSFYPGKHSSFWNHCCRACSHAKFRPWDV